MKRMRRAGRVPGFVAAAALCMALLTAGGCASSGRGNCGNCSNNAAGAAVSQATGERLADLEKKVSYLISELAAQRGDLDRLKEKVEAGGEGSGK